jgi:hypothetical protein
MNKARCHGKSELNVVWRKVDDNAEIEVPVSPPEEALACNVPN